MQIKIDFDIYNFNIRYYFLKMIQNNKLNYIDDNILQKCVQTLHISILFFCIMYLGKSRIKNIILPKIIFRFLIIFQKYNF